MVQQYLTSRRSVTNAEGLLYTDLFPPLQRKAYPVPAPIRIVQHRPVILEEDRIVCTTIISRLIVLGAFLLGLAGVVTVALVPVGSRETPLMIAFVLMPSVGFLLAAFFLLFFDRRTVIDVPQRRISLQERMIYLPMNTQKQRLDEFDRIDVAIRTPGRESNPSNYCTLLLKGPDEETPLFDMEDFARARRTAREMAELLGLSGP